MFEHKMHDRQVRNANLRQATWKAKRRIGRRDTMLASEGIGYRIKRAHLSSRRLSELRADFRFPEHYREPPITDDVIDGWFGALVEEATDAGESMPSERVLDEAKRIVRRLRKQLPLDTDIYSMDEGKVAIELYGDFGHGFLLVCEPGGSALCIITVGGVSRRARYESSSGLPDGFLVEGLKDVRPVF